MTGRQTTDGKVVSLRLTVGDWAKLITVILVFVTGPLVGAAAYMTRLEGEVTRNSEKIRENHEANDRTASALAEVTRTLDRISGRLDAP